MAHRHIPWVLLLVVLLAPAQARPAPAGHEAQNEAIARRYYETLNSHSFERLDAVLSPWVVHHDAPAGESLSAKQLTGDFEALQAAFPDFNYEVKEVVSSGNKVAVRYRFSGTQKGAVMGLEPTGKKASAWAVDLLRIEEGKIREVWGSPLTETLRQNLTVK